MILINFVNYGSLTFFQISCVSSKGLYKNITSNSNNWIALQFEGWMNVNRNAIGTRVELSLSDGNTLISEVNSGDSRGAGNQMIQHFGLGGNSLLQVKVKWPSGLTQDITVLALNSKHTRGAFRQF